MAKGGTSLSEKIDNWILEYPVGTVELLYRAYELVRSNNYTSQQRHSQLANLVTKNSKNDEMMVIYEVSPDGSEDVSKPSSEDTSSDAVLQGNFLISVEIENFRQYWGPNKMEFSVDPDAPLTLLLSHDNFTGKTNFLNAICWGLFGELANPNDEDPKILVNWRALEEDPDARVMVTTIIQVGATKFKIIRSADKDQAEQGNPVVEIFEIDEKGNERPGNYAEYESSFPKIFRQIFFLPGESINAMDKGEDVVENIPFKRGIETLLRTQDLKDAIRDLEGVLDNKALKPKDKKGEQALKNQTKKVEQAREHKIDLEKQIANSEEEIRRCNEKMRRLRETVPKESDSGKLIEAYEKKKTELEVEKDAIDRNMSLLKSFVEEMCECVFSHLSSESLNAGLARLKIAESAQKIPANINKEVLIGSLESGVCELCDQKLTDKAKKKIKQLDRQTRSKKEDVYATQQRHFLENQSTRHNAKLYDLQERINELAQTLGTMLADDESLEELHASVIDARKKLTTDHRRNLKAKETFDAENDKKLLDAQQAAITELLQLERSRTAHKTHIETIKTEKIPKAVLKIKDEEKTLEKAGEGNEEAERVTRARSFVDQAINVLEKMYDGLCGEGREVFEREMSKIFHAMIPDGEIVAHIKDDFVIEYTKESGQKAMMSTAQKILGYGAYAAALSTIAPQFQNLLDPEEIWDQVSEVTASDVSSCPIVLDAPTTSIAPKRRTGFLELLTGLLPQVVITTFIAENDREIWEPIEEKVGKIAMITESGPEVVKDYLYWAGKKYPVAHTDKNLPIKQASIEEI